MPLGIFANRSVVETLVLVLTLTVAASILFTGATVAIIEIRDPSVDTSAIVNALVNVITGILGALLGLLAGRSEAMQQLERRPDDGGTVR